VLACVSGTAGGGPCLLPGPDPTPFKLQLLLQLAGGLVLCWPALAPMFPWMPCRQAERRKARSAARLEAA